MVECRGARASSWHLAKLFVLSFLLALCGCLGASHAAAQVLARPGWAGSGIAPEAWWVRAVFYRLDSASFQDSDGDGRGDLPGVVQRLDYLQSLGVDAVLLDGVLRANDVEAFGDLVREASRRQLRVLVTLRARGTATRNTLLQDAHLWLAAGAAGLWLPRSPNPGAGDADYASLLGSMRVLLQGFPGERVLLTDPAPVLLSGPARLVRPSRRIDPGSFHAVRGAQLVSSASFSVLHPEVQPLRLALGAASADTATTNGLLRFAQPPATGAADALADATLLLGSRGAVILDAGTEIGLDLFPGDADTSRPVMQWTPSNRTPTARPETQQGGAAATGEPQFGAYHPYIPPPRGISPRATSSVHVAPDLNVPKALPDPDSLPGFSAAALPARPTAPPSRNVAVADRDPRSMLNSYRQLIALHHANATLRHGTQSVLDTNGEQVLAWARRAPTGSRTVANIVVAANYADHSVLLSVDDGLVAQGMRPGALRTLFSSAPDATTGETTGRLALPAHAVFLGEVYHGGSLSEPAPRMHRRGRRSGHRVRR